MFESVSRHIEAAENRICQLNDVIAEATAEREVLVAAVTVLRKDVFEVAASTNGQSEKRKRGRPKKAVESQSIPKARRMGIASDVVSYLAGKEGATVDVIADSVNCTKQQVSQVLTQGKKKGRFKSVSRGTWALA